MQDKLIAGRYRILAELGKGAHGVVYKCHDEKLNRPVAVKVLRTDSRKHLDRFMREAEVLAAVKHPHIVTVFDRGTDDGNAFFVMEYLTGPDLGRIIYETDRLSIAQALGFAVPIADAIWRLHQHAPKVIHRDIKPQNLVLDGDGLVKLCDFGLAALPDAQITKLTMPGVKLGTVAYVSPEQCQEVEAAEPTDVYSFGAVLYTMLAGRPPIDVKGTFSMVAQRIRYEEPIPLGQLCPDLPQELVRLVHAMLAKSPEQRPETDAVREMLRHLTHGRPHAAAERALTGEFARVRARFEAGASYGPLRMVRLDAKARAMLGPDHPLVNEIRAYLELMSSKAPPTRSPWR